MELVAQKYKQTELGLIPIDWEVKKLFELTSLMTNGFVGTATIFYSENDDDVLYIQGYNVEENGFNFKGIKYVTQEFHKQHSKSCLQEGDLLTIQTGECGLTTVVPLELVGSNCHALIISRFRKDKSNSKYFSYYFNSPVGRSRLKTIETGTTMKHINVGDMLQFLVPVPPTKAEQTAIATALSDADALISGLEKLLTKKRNIKQGAMQKLLQPKEGWELKKLGEKADIFRGGSPRPIENYLTIHPDGINWIKIGDVKKNAKYIESTEEKIIPEGLSRSRFVNEGDFLLSNSMSFGRPYILKIKGCIHDGWLVIQNYQDHFDRDFLYYVLGSEAILQQYKSMASGSSVLNLNKEIVKNVIINCPKSVEEQADIAKVLSDMDEAIISLETKLEKYRNMKSGMMQNLLTGKIRLN